MQGATDLNMSGARSILIRKTTVKMGWKITFDKGTNPKGFCTDKCCKKTFGKDDLCKVCPIYNKKNI